MIKLGLIGDPISHSLSPIIHSIVMEYLNIPYKYESYSIKKGELANFISTVKNEEISGFNVTMPHKTDIIKYLDFQDNESLRYNSVNTVKYEDGKLYGYNTDANGFLMSLQHNNIDIKNKKILILGAGGVANSIAIKLALEEPKEIIILNRTQDNAKTLCNIIKEYSNTTTCYSDINIETISKYAKKTDILINSTPLGMEGVNSDFESFEFLNNLDKSSIVYDLVYKPMETNLLKHARNLGLKTINGLEMLIYQALISDEIYTGKEFDFKELSKIIKERILYINKML